jgi:alanine racemase
VGLPVHAKVDTGMGRFGMSPAEAAQIDPGRVAGVMSHLATADEDDAAFVGAQLDAFAAVVERFPGAIRHVANSAATLSIPEARLDAVRCGVALYGLSPFGRDPDEYGLEPVLSWRSYVAQAKVLRRGDSTGYGRRFVAEGETRIGLVPVGYGDGFRRGLTGTEVLVAGTRRRVLGTVSMDSFAVELGDEPEGAPVTLVGEGVLVEEHAGHAGTINYEITTGMVSDPRRAERRVVDG